MRRTRIEIRCTEDDLSRIKAKAESAALTVSEYLRRTSLERRVASLVDAQAVGELRHVAAMLKHLYPKDANWTMEEKRRYWVGYERLMEIAADIEGMAHAGRKDSQ